MILKSNNQDSRFFSADIALAFGDTNAAIVIQQLHYWIEKRQGIVIDNIRWIHNSYKKWIEEQFKWFSTWQLRKIFGRLKELGVVKVKRHWASHYNQTNFYTIDYDRLIKFVKEKTGVTIETTELCADTNGGEECPQIELRIAHNSYTKTTSKDYQQILDPPPTPSVKKESVEKTKTFFSEDPASEDPWITEEDKNTSFQIVKPLEKKKEPRRVVHYRERIRQQTDVSTGPWESVKEFNLFYEALISALPTVANARNADAVAKIIVSDLCSGIPHSYWLDWKNGDAIGTTDKPEWQATPGIPHPMFVEYLAEYLRGEGDDAKTAKKKAYDYLTYPDRVRGLWREFKRDLEGVMARVEDAKKLGATASVPTWFVPREEVSLEQAAETALWIQEQVVTEDRLVLRHEVERREQQIFAQSSFDRLIFNCERELIEASKHGYDGQARKAIALVKKNVRTEEDLARLKKMVQDLYPTKIFYLEEEF